VPYFYASVAAATTGALGRFFVDDLILGNAGPLGALYCDDKRPSSDSAVDWTPSGAGDNYEQINQTPASDAAWNYSDVDADKDLLGLTAWDGTDKDPVAVAAWVRARMEDASGDSIVVGIDSNGTESDTTSPIAASYEYYHHIDLVNPDGGGAWDEAAINAALLKYESVIT